MTIELPDFEILKKQPKIPHVSSLVAAAKWPNEYGTLIEYKVQQSRNRAEWWLYATLNGMRLSNTLHTTVRTKADVWIKAVKEGRITIAERR